MLTRRAFLQTTAATGAATLADVAGLRAARYDLVILMLGMPLDQVLERATINSAHSLPDFGDLGTLGVGAAADLAVLELRAGEFEFVDNANTARKGKTKLFTHASVFAGKLVKGSALAIPASAEVRRSS